MVGHDWGWVGRFGLGWVGGGAWGDRISIAKSIPSNRRILADTPRGPVALRERHGPEPHLSWDRRGVARWVWSARRYDIDMRTKGTRMGEHGRMDDPIGHCREQAGIGLSFLCGT
jgi:hypothetical protein